MTSIYESMGLKTPKRIPTGKSVFHVRIDSPGYNSDGIQFAWEELGWQYEGFCWQSFRFSNGIEATRKAIIEKANELNPDVILLHIQNSEIFDLQTFIELQKIGKVINFTFDARPFVKFEWMYLAAKHISLTCFACREDVEECNRRGIENIMLSQSSCNFIWYNKWPIIPPTEKQFPEVAFIGNNYKGANNEFPLSGERQEMIESLYERFGDKFTAYGLGQNGGIVNPQQEIEIYNRCKIVICHNNLGRFKYQSDRVWRAMGCGAFVLLKSEPGVGEMFSIEKHCDIWHDFEDLKEKIQYYLDNENERAEIAVAGMQWARTTQRWQDRIKEMLGFLKITY